MITFGEAIQRRWTSAYDIDRYDIRRCLCQRHTEFCCRLGNGDAASRWSSRPGLAYAMRIRSAVDLTVHCKRPDRFLSFAYTSICRTFIKLSSRKWTVGMTVRMVVVVTWFQSTVCLSRLRSAFSKRAFSYVGPAAWKTVPCRFRPAINFASVERLHKLILRRT